jgi:N-acetylmuramoyl-L-alanine amidase
MKICIDPGHSGRPDPGAIGCTGSRESDLNLTIAKILTEKLAARGDLVILTRILPEQPETDSLANRCFLANTAKVDLFLSIHCNSFTDPAAHGFEVWYYSGSDAGKNLAAKIRDSMSLKIPLYNRGICPSSSLFVLKHTSAPAVLIECGFISNPDDEKYLLAQAGQTAIAAAIVQALCEI